LTTAALAHIPDAAAMRHYTRSSQMVTLDHTPEGKLSRRDRMLSENDSVDDDNEAFSPDGKRIMHETSHTQYAPTDGVLLVQSKTKNGKRVSNSQIRQENQMLLREKSFDASHPKPRGALSDILTPDFAIHLVGHDTLNGHDCILLEAAPLKVLANPRRDLRYRIWIDPSGPWLLRSSAESLADDSIGVQADGYTSRVINLKGSQRTTTYTVFNGTTLPVQITSDDIWENIVDLEPMHTSRVLTYSNWRYFTAIVTIGPATVIEP